jgi:hypothetical protein
MRPLSLLLPPLLVLTAAMAACGPVYRADAAASPGGGVVPVAAPRRG